MGESAIGERLIIVRPHELDPSTPLEGTHIVLLPGWRREPHFYLLQIEVWRLQRQGAIVEEL